MMSMVHRVIAASYRPLRLARAIGRRMGLVPPDSLRVMIYHDIAPPEMSLFAEQLRWLARHWDFISPGSFADIISGEEQLRGRKLLLTFDDGFASNRVAAEEILNPMGLKALFFPVSDFVAIEDHDEARRFIANNIRINEEPGDLPSHLRNMSWLDLEALLEQGHSIGAHTMTHARLSEIEEEKDLEREIVAGGDVMERRLGVAIEHFSFTFGNMASISCKARAVARKRYRFIFAGLRGDNARNTKPDALWRDAARPGDSKAFLGACLEGAADIRYARSRARFRSEARAP